MSDEVKKLLDRKETVVIFRNGMGRYTAATFDPKEAAPIFELVGELDDFGNQHTSHFEPSKALKSITEKRLGTGEYADWDGAVEKATAGAQTSKISRPVVCPWRLLKALAEEFNATRMNHAGRDASAEAMAGACCERLIECLKAINTGELDVIPKAAIVE